MPFGLEPGRSTTVLNCAGSELGEVTENRSSLYFFSVDGGIQSEFLKRRLSHVKCLMMTTRCLDG